MLFYDANFICSRYFYRWLVMMWVIILWFDLIWRHFNYISNEAIYYIIEIFIPSLGQFLRGQGVSIWSTIKIGFMVFFWKRGVRPSSCFLPFQKILILAEVIAGQKSAPMCNFIVCTIFICVYLKYKSFKLQNLSSPTVFEQSFCNLQETFRANFEKNCPAKLWIRSLNHNYGILNILDMVGNQFFKL